MERLDKESLEQIARNFYGTLYKVTNPDLKQIRKYSEKNWEVRINEDQQKRVNNPFTLMEIREALKH